MRLAQLLEELPRMEEATSPDEQIRAALRPVIERAAVLAEVPQPEPYAEDPASCPNCGAPHLAERSPYCSPLCRDTAAMVRQLRNWIANGDLSDTERQAGMGQALWSLQGGGYPRRQSMVTAKVISKVIERDGGICSICGAPATEIDHTGSG